MKNKINNIQINKAPLELNRNPTAVGSEKFKIPEAWEMGFKISIKNTFKYLKEVMNELFNENN